MRANALRLSLGAAILVVACVVFLFFRSRHEDPDKSPPVAKIVQPHDDREIQGQTKPPHDSSVSFAARVSQRKEAIRRALMRHWNFSRNLDEFGRDLGEPQMSQEEMGEMSFRLLMEYQAAALEDTPTSYIAILELMREISDPKLREFACREFHPSEMPYLNDPREMLAILLQEAQRETDPLIQHMIFDTLGVLGARDRFENRLKLTDGELQTIMNLIETSKNGPSYPGLYGMRALWMYVTKPAVKDFAIRLAMRDQAPGAIEMLEMLPDDPDAHQAVTSFMFRDDLPNLQMVTLRHLRRASLCPGEAIGASLTSDNPLAVDYLTKLKQLYSTTDRKEVRSTILERLPEFDMPQAADSAGTFLRDERLDVVARSQALENVVFVCKSEEKNPYPQSKDAWLNVLEGVGNDTAVISKIRVQAYMAWISVLLADHASLDALGRGELLRLMTRLQGDSDPQVRAAGEKLRERAKRFGIRE